MLTKLILIVLYQVIKQIPSNLGWLNLPAGGTLLNGVVVGLICNDLTTGMEVGGMYELMNVGLNPLGGAAVPNYNLGSIVGVYYACTVDMEMGTAMGIIIASLATGFNAFANYPNLIIRDRINKAIKEHDWKTVYKLPWIACWTSLPFTLLPQIILIGLGESAATAIIENTPTRLVNAFTMAGNVLPAIGFAVVIRSLNVEKNIEWLILGFCLYAYMGVNTLGASLIGFACCLIMYKQDLRFKTAGTAVSGGIGDE